MPAGIEAPDFRRRSRAPELMDDASLSYAEFRHCLRELETINRLTLAYRPTLAWLDAVLPREEEVCILDAGSGGGDMLRRIETLARRSGRQVQLLGVDRHPWSARAAREAAPDSSVHYLTADLFEVAPERPVDFVISALFTHHLDDESAVRFLRWMHARARRGWFINDLHRHPLPYHFIRAATALGSRNRLIRHDAPVSVARAFTRADWRGLLERADIHDPVDIHWHFPFRLCLSCLK